MRTISWLCDELTYAPETCVLKENMTNKLMTFERKTTRKIFGPTRTNDGY